MLDLSTHHVERISAEGDSVNATLGSGQDLFARANFAAHYFAAIDSHPRKQNIPGGPLPVLIRMSLASKDQ